MHTVHDLPTASTSVAIVAHGGRISWGSSIRLNWVCSADVITLQRLDEGRQQLVDG
jgi:hypothetical protein